MSYFSEFSVLIQSKSLVPHVSFACQLYFIITHNRLQLEHGRKVWGDLMVTRGGDFAYLVGHMTSRRGKLDSACHALSRFAHAFCRRCHHFDRRRPFVWTAERLSCGLALLVLDRYRQGPQRHLQVHLLAQGRCSPRGWRHCRCMFVAVAVFYVLRVVMCFAVLWWSQASSPRRACKGWLDRVLWWSAARLRRRHVRLRLLPPLMLGCIVILLWLWLSAVCMHECVVDTLDCLHLRSWLKPSSSIPHVFFSKIRFGCEHKLG